MREKKNYFFFKRGNWGGSWLEDPREARPMSGSARTALQGQAALRRASGQAESSLGDPTRAGDARTRTARLREGTRGWGPHRSTPGSLNEPATQERSLRKSMGSRRPAPAGQRHGTEGRRARRLPLRGLGVSPSRSRSSPWGSGPLLARPPSAPHQPGTGPPGLTGSFRPSARGSSGAKAAICSQRRE